MSYLSLDNRDMLIHILQQMCAKKYNYDIMNSSINIKKIFQQIMKKMEIDHVDTKLSLKDKNKLTLKIMKEILIKELSLNNTNREHQIYPDRKVNINEIKQEHSFNTNNNDVSTKMKLLENNRNDENVLEMPSFNDIHKTLNETAFDTDDFKDKIQALENERLDFNKKLQDIYPLAKDDESSTFIEKRNKDMSVIMNKKLEDVDPKQFYTQNENKNKEMSSNTINYQYKNDNLALILDEKAISKILVKKYILINSYDRNWIVDKFRYQYKVKFTHNINNIIRVPYYENNPTIPFTKSDQSDGIKNVYGWVDKNGNTYPSYNSLIPKGEELGFEEIEVMVDQDASIFGTFKEIYSIKITNVAIPSEMSHQLVNTVNIHSGDTYSNFNFNFPYILLNIDEFQDVYDGTDGNIRKCFCQLQYYKFIKTPNGRGFIIFKPVQDESKIFYPSPLGVLSSLNISLTKPNGELLNKSVDGIGIFNISQYQNYYLKITTKTYFLKDAFCNGDYIRIKNFMIYRIINQSNPERLHLLNTYINKEEGHQIYELGEPNDDGYYNSFHIFAPGELNINTGTFDVETNLMDVLGEFNTFLADNDFYENHGITYTNGNIINMSLQNSISITVEMYTPDSKPIIS